MPPAAPYVSLRRQENNRGPELWLLGGGLLPELGWTGFAVPRFRLRHGVLGVGLVMGVLWGAYHFSVIYWWGLRLTGRSSVARVARWILLPRLNYRAASIACWPFVAACAWRAAGPMDGAGR